MMRKIGLVILALFICSHTFANTQDISKEIAKNLKIQNELSNSNKDALIYGGKDISRPVLATAHESSVWAGEPRFIG